jgi:F0F1-type ATP synthase assembly protein I
VVNWYKVKAAEKSTTKNQKIRSEKRLFYVAALNMSWQLAIVVLIPIFVGWKVDESTNNAPVFTFIGFFIAMGGMSVVMWRALQRFSPPAENGLNK